MSRRRKSQPRRRGTPGRAVVDHDSAVWVSSDVMPDGSYAVTVHTSSDRSYVLDRDHAIGYATAAYDVAARAEYDAAVWRQLVERGVGKGGAAQLVVDLRRDRPPVAGAAPLLLDPGVAHDPDGTVRAFVHVYVAGQESPQPLTQWTPDELRQHAGHVLDCLAVVDLDAAYRRCLVGVIGLDDPTARAVVGTLAAYRPGA